VQAVAVLREPDQTVSALIAIKLVQPSPCKQAHATKLMQTSSYKQARANKLVPNNNTKYLQRGAALARDCLRHALHRMTWQVGR
jgi:hypothetical protein